MGCILGYLWRSFVENVEEEKWDFSIREVTPVTLTVVSSGRVKPRYLGSWPRSFEEKMSIEAALTMRQLIFVDEETGECFDVQDQLQEVNNVETGEPEVNVDTRRIRRKVPFQIPRDVQESVPSTKKINGFVDIESIPQGDSFGRINPICLFLPAIIYFRWFLAVLLLMEVILHVYSHRKNKNLKDSNVYYQSPFHGISSEFCAFCQSENCMNRVDKMQQARMHRFLKQCNYMKRVVT